MPAPDASHWHGLAGIMGSVVMADGELFEIVGDLVDAGLSTNFILVAAWRAGNADGTDRLLSDHDRQRAAGSHDVGEHQLGGGRILADVLGKLAGCNAERARRVGLLQ